MSDEKISRKSDDKRVINTGGGAYVEGEVDINSGDFVGRDQYNAGLKPEDVKPLFEPIISQIESRPDTQPEDKADLKTDLEEIQGQRPGRRMKGLPDTRTKRSRTAWGLWIVPILLLGVALLLLEGGGRNVSGEEVRAAGVEEISASTGRDPFPDEETSIFPRGTRTVRVSLRVEDAPVAGEMFATVGRSGRTSALGRVFGGSEVVAEGGGDGRLTVSDEGVSGVVSFVVAGSDGGALPAGTYEVEVRFVGGEGTGGSSLVARKYFEIGDRQT